MKHFWLPGLAAALVLVGCAPDRTLETLIPRDALAVVLVDHPSWVSQSLGPQTADLPWASLDGNRPWAGAVTPANPPGFLLALALGSQDSAWPSVEAWARNRGGLTAVRVGTYAVLSTPDHPVSGGLPPPLRFDLERVRALGTPVAAYLDTANLLASGVAGLPPELQAPVVANLAGLRLGLDAKDGGLELRLSTDWKAGAPAAAALKGWKAPVEASSWTGYLAPSEGVGVAASLSPVAWQQLGQGLPGPVLGRWWSALAPLLGSRLAVSVSPAADGTWAWGAAIESTDPQAVRQALKTLVASGELQRHFGEWALDPDTPFVYQDQPDGRGGVHARITLGEAQFHLGYGNQRIALAPGTSGLVPWLAAPPAPAAWAREARTEAQVVATGTLDGLSARASVEVRPDGAVELRTWIDRAGVKVWEERLPQALVGWLSGSAGWTRWEP